jgi:hypothetical protein
LNQQVIDYKCDIVARGLAYWNPYLEERARLEEEARKWTSDKAGRVVPIAAPAGWGRPFDWKDIGRTVYVPLWCEMFRNHLGPEYLAAIRASQLHAARLGLKWRYPLGGA